MTVTVVTVIIILKKIYILQCYHPRVSKSGGRGYTRPRKLFLGLRKLFVVERKTANKVHFLPDLDCKKEEEKRAVDIHSHFLAQTCFNCIFVPANQIICLKSVPP